MLYMPIIRSKRYDLKALSELVHAHALSRHVRPVIEPVKDDRALVTTLQAFEIAHQPIYWIQNPQVGHYQLLERPRYRPTTSEYVQPARYFDPRPTSLALATTFQQVQLLSPTQKVIVPNESRVRTRHLPQAIYLEDHFTVYARTEDYANLVDEFYQYRRETLPGIGFSDYPLSTRHYNDKGHPQKALAIHIVYIADDKTLRLRHFVSHDHENYQHGADKFFDLADQLAAWLTKRSLTPTLGLSAMLTSAKAQHFPGLGAIRKWQLMHHLEMIGRWLA